MVKERPEDLPASTPLTPGYKTIKQGSGRRRRTLNALARLDRTKEFEDRMPVRGYLGSAGRPLICCAQRQRLRLARLSSCLSFYFELALIARRRGTREE